MDEKLYKLVRKNKPLFWFTAESDLHQLSEDAVVETILNYGSLDDFRELVSIMGIDKVADIFYRNINISKRRRNNFHPKILNFFDLVFKRYAYRDTER